MTPSFSIIVKNKNPKINKGNIMNFSVYISGYGHVENNSKIYFSLPQDLVDINNNKTFAYVEYYRFKNNSGERVYLKDLEIVNKTFNKYDYFYIVFPSYFYSQFNSSNKCYDKEILMEEPNDASNGFKDPISVTIYTSNNAPEGDNKINLVLTYGDGRKWYQDKSEVKFHVNSFVEQYYVFQIVTASIGSISFFIGILPRLKKRFKKQQVDFNQGRLK